MNQSIPSFEEHREAYHKITKIVTNYKNNTSNSTNGIVLVGAGGVGKTIDMRLAALYMISQGLRVYSTCLMGKRGAELGGRHLAVLFKYPTQHGLSTTEMAEKCVYSLTKDPKLFALLNVLDALCIDEIGQLSTQHLIVLHLTLCRIRQNYQPFGGIIIICTLDHLQLQPIDGQFCLFNPIMLTSMIYHRYLLPLRTMCEILLRIQEITRMSAEELNIVEQHQRGRQDRSS